MTASRVMLMILAASMVSGCDLKPEAKEQAQDQKTASDQQLKNEESNLTDRAKIAVQGVLKDPESARFEQLTITRNSAGTEAVCGFVNAKNEYGGYAGRQPFSFSEKGVAIVSQKDETQLDALLSMASTFINISTYPAPIRHYHLAGCAGPEKEAKARIFDEIYTKCIPVGGVKCFNEEFAANRAAYEAVLKK